MPRTWSPQQEAIFAAIETPRGGSLQIRAVAGSGKTTTLVESCARMTGSVAFCAYNRPVAEEIKIRVAHLKHVKAGTFHSFGYLAWSRHIGTYLKPDPKKVRTLVEAPERAIPEWAHEFIVKLVSLAKQSAYGVTRPLADEDWWTLIEHYDVAESLPELIDDQSMQDALRWTREVLTASNNAGRVAIDFDDQLYLPLLFNARMWQNDWVLVDEAQDTNVARRMLARKMLKAGGRLVSVGDPHQAIYGFAGAQNDALDLIAKDFSCVSMPLTVSYRCPQAVVAHAQQWVSHIEAAPTADVGSVTTIDQAAFESLTKDALGAGDAVLCRNTAPLVEQAFKLIRRGIGAKVEGRDIGANLVALALRWKSVKTAAALSRKLDEYRDRETQKLLAKGHEMKAAAVEDRVDTLQAIIAGSCLGGTVADVTAAIGRLFGDTEPGAPVSTVILSTIHKSKGREWARVYLLGRNIYQPSPYARQPWQLDQEVNLMYVAVTRAQASLVEVAMTPRTRR